MKPIIDGIVGARPNMMKMAPLARAVNSDAHFELRIVHTGQHYDYNMSRVFFDELGLPEPCVNLEAGIETNDQEEQTAGIILRYAKFLKENERPCGVVVVGDVNSTLACSIVAAKRLIPVAHVEAGLRSFDRSMPEEINRIVCDTLSDIHFVTETSGLINLSREGKNPDHIYFVGNIMIDNLFATLPRIKQSDVLDRFQLKQGNYVLVTMHRPSNVDNAAVLKDLMKTFDELSQEKTIILAAHPRTFERINEFGCKFNSPNVILTEPLSYVDNLRLMRDAWCVLTDSGGMQEECSVLNVPCLTLRDNTERPVTVELGSSELVGNKPDKIKAAWKKLAKGNWHLAKEIPLWDGRTAQRIVEILRRVWS